MKALRLTLVLLTLAGAALPVAVRADDDDHDRARSLVERGRIKPLDEILARLPASYRGEVLSVELDEDDGRYVYEIELLTADGRRVKVEVDAARGTIVSGDDDDDD
jgi:uncharacterized membrane protein YkoI